MKEPLVIFIGFLGAGKTTLMKDLVPDLIRDQFNPFVILNDYQNASLDAQWFRNQFEKLDINPLSGSCVCCSGIRDLQFALQNPPENRPNPITLLEANGTTDPIEVLSFLSVGLENYTPPIQITPVNVQLWQQRGDYNDLERLQVSTASIITFTWTESSTPERLQQVREEVQSINPNVEFWKKTDFQVFPKWVAEQSQNLSTKTVKPPENHQHHKSHWSSCEIDLPETLSKAVLVKFLESLDIPNLRLKGCARLADEHGLPFYFEKFMDKQLKIRPFPGQPAFEGKCILIAPQIDLSAVETLLNRALKS